MRLILSVMFLCLFSIQAVAAGGAYKLQVGDRLDVTVWQDEKLRRVIVVRPDGGISFPLAGHMAAAGATIEALEARLKGRLQKFYRESLDVSIMLTSTLEKAPQDSDETEIVYVTGEVKKPGPFIMDRPTNVLQAIALSGGLGPFAAKKRIQVRRRVRGEDVYFAFNYKAVERGDELEDNIYLHDGDVIVVPERRLFE